MTLGVTSILLFYYLTRILELHTVETLFANFFTYFILAVVVIFQQEIRRGLATLGRGKFFLPLFTPGQRANLNDLVLAATQLAQRRIGGLIVLEREIGLRNYIETGIKLDSLLSHDLLFSIFHRSSPLHDGAVIIQADRIAAAACYLPLDTSPHLSRKWGSRHRAGLGVSEETDAISIVISEETGSISVAFQGHFTQNLDEVKLLTLLQKLMGNRPAGFSGTVQERLETK